MYKLCAVVFWLYRLIARNLRGNRSKFANRENISFQVIAVDLTNHTDNMEDLIWQGSQISASGKLFSHSELKAKLKDLDQRWQNCRNEAQERLSGLQIAQQDLAEKELKFVEICGKLDKIREIVNVEKSSKDRTEENLEMFLKNYEVCKLILRYYETVLDALSLVQALVRFISFKTVMYSESCMFLKYF